MKNQTRFSTGRIIRISAAAAGVLLIAWIALFSGIAPRVNVFELVGAPTASAAGYDAEELGRLRLLSRCIGYIRAGYVVPERVRPMSMMVGALKAAEGMVPDLMVTFDDPSPEKATSVEVRVGDVIRVFQLERMSDLYQVNWRLQDIFEFISKNLPPDVKPEDVEYAAINGLLEPLDEHSMFLPPEAYEQMQLDTQGRFGGLGIVISSRSGYVTIVSVMDDTPAKAGGLKSGDQIIEIDAESTMNMPLTDAVSHLRGDPGSKVSIVLNRKGWTEPKSVTLERAEIKVRSVKTEDLGEGIGYARILHFQEDTAEDLKFQVAELRRKGALKGLVLDLRENPGGLLDQAVEVGDLFLRSGTLVVTQGEGNRMRQEFEAEPGDVFESLPIVALVDGGSASAAEIVAGALKYNDRAILLGMTTFGKGTVQVMHEVGDGALKLTVAQYLIPGDLSIQGVGVVPDIEIVPTHIGRNNILTGLPDYKRWMDPDRRLDAFGSIADDIPVEIVPYLAKTTEDIDDESDELKEPPVEDEVFERDEAMELAARILVAGPGVAKRTALLERARPAVATWRAENDAGITSALAGRGVDWTGGPSVEQPVVSAIFQADEDVMAGEAVVESPASPSPGPLTAGASATLTMSVTNRGDKPLFRVRCASKSDNQQLDAREFLFGRIDPGATVTRTVRFKVPRETWQRRDRVELSLYQNVLDPIPGGQDAYVDFVPVAHPRFGFTYQLVDAGGNGDGILNPGEKADLVVLAGNGGMGDSPKLMVSLRNTSGDRLYLHSGRETLTEGIPAGESRVVRFGVERRRDTDASAMKVEFSMLDLAIREYLSEEIEILSSIDSGAPFVPAPGLIQASGTPAVSIRAAASADSMVLASVPDGTVLKSAGFFPGWYRVEMENGLWGFIPGTQAIELRGAGPSALLPPVLLTNEAPVVDVRFDRIGDSGDKVRVSGTVTFMDARTDVRRKVLIFRDKDKVYFWTRKGPLGNPVIQVDAEVSLRGGRNPLALYAVEGKDRSSVRRFNLHLPEIVLPEAASVAPAIVEPGQ